jgi:hypothetical protein
MPWVLLGFTACAGQALAKGSIPLIVVISIWDVFSSIGWKW